MIFPDLDFDVIEDVSFEPPKKNDIRLYTLDIETLPFKHKRFPEPFTCGLWDGLTFRSTWGENCIDEMIAIIETMEPGIIYIHNGGRFDVFYFVKCIWGRPAMIINNRIVRGVMVTPKGRMELRDSYAIMPFPLASYKKDEIDYRLFEKDKREKHKAKILEYLKGDCVYLYDLCSAFIDMFGPRLTIGSASMKELRTLHNFDSLGAITDKDIRSNYYYGGRVQFFKQGIVPGPWKVFDVNSMYPAVMKNFEHPVEMPSMETVKIRRSTCFITAEGKNHGAFPQKTKDGLRFDIEYGRFSVSRHEWDAALTHGLFEPTKIIRCVNFDRRISFAEFVDKFYILRKQAKDCNDDIHALLYKFCLNSAYGKFAQNPEGYFEYILDGPRSDYRSHGWIPASIPDPEMMEPSNPYDFIMWKKPAREFARYNVATGASITGAARAVLMDAIARSDTPIYCDTDSLICRNLDGVKIDKSELGAWKLEMESHTAMIARRKLYALMGSSCPKCGGTWRVKRPSKKCKDIFHTTGCVKIATKGVKISPKEIEDVCNGKTVTYNRDAPSFKMDGSHQFITRRIKI